MTKKKMQKDNPEREQVSFLARSPRKRKQPAPKPPKMSLTKIKLLRALQDFAGKSAGKYCRIAAIANASGLGYTQTANTLSVIKEGGLVVRTVSPGNKVLYKITGKGIAALRGAGG